MKAYFKRKEEKLDEKDPGADAVWDADQDCIGEAEYNIKRTGCSDRGDRSNDHRSDLWKKQQKGNQEINYEGIRTGGHGMRRENEGNATNKTIVTERRNKKAVACRFWTRARKYLEYLKNHDRKGKISDQDYLRFSGGVR